MPGSIEWPLRDTGYISLVYIACVMPSKSVNMVDALSRRESTGSSRVLTRDGVQKRAEKHGGLEKEKVKKDVQAVAVLDARLHGLEIGEGALKREVEDAPERKLGFRRRMEQLEARMQQTDLGRLRQRVTELQESLRANAVRKNELRGEIVRLDDETAGFNAEMKVKDREIRVCENDEVARKDLVYGLAELERRYPASNHDAAAAKLLEVRAEMAQIRLERSAYPEYPDEKRREVAALLDELWRASYREDVHRNEYGRLVQSLDSMEQAHAAGLVKLAKRRETFENNLKEIPDGIAAVRAKAANGTLTDEQRDWILEAITRKQAATREYIRKLDGSRTRALEDEIRVSAKIREKMRRALLDVELHQRKFADAYETFRRLYVDRV